MSFKNILDAFDIRKKVTTPDFSSLSKFQVPEINDEVLQSIRPVMPEILDEIKANNRDLRKANEELIKALQQQHLENQINQRSSSRLSTFLSVANILLVLITLVPLFLPNKQVESSERLSNQMQELLKSSSDILNNSSSLIELDKQVDFLKAQRESDLIRIDSLEKFLMMKK